MSLAGAGAGGGPEIPCRGGPGPGPEGALYSVVQCIIGNGHVRHTSSVCTDAYKNITFPKLRWQAATRTFEAKILNSDILKFLLRLCDGKRGA